MKDSLLLLLAFGEVAQAPQDSPWPGWTVPEMLRIIQAILADCRFEGFWHFNGFLREPPQTWADSTALEASLHHIGRRSIRCSPTCQYALTEDERDKQRLKRCKVSVYFQSILLEMLYQPPVSPTTTY